ncbi:MAG: hypothetical protein WD801_12030 [Gemmatimonadaceae bacterium]
MFLRRDWPTDAGAARAAAPQIARHLLVREGTMFQSFIDLFPAEWRGAVTVLAAPLRWIPEWQSALLNSMTGQYPIVMVFGAVTLLMPTLLLITGVWSTMVSVYTLPFRSGRGGFITALLMAWWDAGRSIWLYWMGIARFFVALFGWALGALRFVVLTMRNTLVGLVRSPLAALDWTSRRYFQPGMPWIAFLVLLLWTGVEATVFTFTLQPTLTEVFGGITGIEPNPNVMAPLLWVFLFMLVAGSFACVQVLTDAIRNRRVSEIIQMTLVESAVMFFEVIFLYRELIDAVTPWIAQQSAGEVRLGLVSTLLLASFGWVGVRGMSWFLFGRFGTPALLAILSRQTITQDAVTAPAPDPVRPGLLSAPVDALKADVIFFQLEGKRLFELLSVPVLQLLAVAVNFAVVVVQSRPAFPVPFKSLDDLLAVNPFTGAGPARSPRFELNNVVAMATPRDMPKVAS